ncbi:hypothetical protein ACEZDB_36330 [Streptacidiphilus sp. N1-3]|uniref:Secreted protein n=1 Tax=Streptacidiphilus alkalitolerans TaxID=3342712 RepID=A0ABV6XDR3_9ACTN
MNGAVRPRRAGRRLAVLGTTALVVGLMPLAAGASTPTPTPSGSASATPSAPETGPDTPSPSASASGSETPTGHAVPTPSRPSTAKAPATKAKPRTRTHADEAALPCPPVPEGQLDPSRFYPSPPPGSQTLINPAFPGCAYVVGYSDVKKLNGAMVVNDPARSPQLTAIGVGVRLVYQPDTGYFEVGSIGGLTLPDSTSTFLTFGFTPTKARVHFVVESPLTIEGLQLDSDDLNVKTSVSYYMHLQLQDVRVNGVPLDAGTNCRSGRIHVVLNGTTDKGYDMYAGGRLTGFIDIPPFTGCVSRGQNLDPLFTASISGPGNYLDFVQSPLCTDVTDCHIDGLVPPPLPAY